MPDANDLIFTKSALPELTIFLISDEIYWPLPSPLTDSTGIRHSRFSLGLLLMALHRLKLAATTPAEEHEINNTYDAVWGVRSRFRVAWEKKAAREYQTRLRSWQALLGELLADRQPSNAIYRANVRARVILQHLSPELPQPPDNDQQLARLDERLSIHWSPGNFIWDQMLQSAYPQPEFWYLYGEIAGKPQSERGS